MNSVTWNRVEMNLTVFNKVRRSDDKILSGPVLRRHLDML